MTVNPIIPIWLMAIICIALAFFRRKGTFNYIRQIAIIVLLFIINLRIMVPDYDAETIKRKIDVLFVVDNTISMQAEDYGSDRCPTPLIPQMSPRRLTAYRGRQLYMPQVQVLKMC